MKKLSEQTIVITGASSGIGLATARLAAERGAQVVLASRNEAELRRIVDEINRRGGRAIAVAADVSDEDQVRRIADAAIEAFGGFDTWFNNAGVSIYGKLLDVPIEDQRRLFDVDFWGEVYGMRVAVAHLRQRGGTLINMGSVTSERAIPLQGAYAAAKQALRAYTDALRMELEAEGAPVAVVLVEPGSIDTPFTEHARSYTGKEPQLPQPVYAPEVVARAVLRAAERPQRRILVGAGGAGVAAFEKVAPRLTDRLMERQFFDAQQQDRPATGQDSLYAPPDHEGELRGADHGRVMEHSAFTYGEQHKGGTLFLAAAAALGGFLAMRSLRASNRTAAQTGAWIPEERRDVEISATEEIARDEIH